MAAFVYIDGFAVYHMRFRHGVDRNHLSLRCTSLATALTNGTE